MGTIKGTKIQGTKILLTLALAMLPGTLGTTVVGCGAAEKLGSLAQMQCGDGFNAETGAVGELGLQAEAKAKVTAFLNASGSLTKAVKDIDVDAIGACKLMAADLSIAEADLMAPDATKKELGGEVRFVCKRVADEVKKLIEENVPTDASLSITYQAARCEVDVAVQQSCVTMCEPKTVTTVECAPGKLSGSCSGSCTGSCSAQCMGMCQGGCTGDCSGTCEGTCTAECTGRCTGTCDGTCDVMGADGKCNGKCTGTCSGTCDAGCKGKCEGMCKGSCSAACTGTCTGGCTASCTGNCSVAFTAPKCEEVKKVVDDCHTSCDTQARASAQCQTPSLLIDFQTNLQPDPLRRQKVAMLIKAMRNGLPRFLKATLKAQQTLGPAVEGYLLALGRVAATASGSVKASACVTVAVGQNTNDGQKLGGAGAANVDLFASLKAKGKAALKDLACKDYDPGRGMKGPTFSGAAGLRLNAVLDASVSLTKAANEVESETMAACRTMGEKLGMPLGDLTAGDPKTLCGRVKAEIEKVMTGLDPMVKVRVVATPAICTVNAMASIMCSETCENKTVTVTDLVCTPAKIAGNCSAMCTGSCRGMCNARISGSCSATCMGSCDAQVSASCTGTCMGTCEGTCSAMGADGSCMGSCMGTCHGRCMGTINGSCQGKCEGMCMGSVEASCSGSCTGNCTGGCSATLTAPYCEEVEVMRVVTECQRSCDTKAKAEAMCTAPSVSVAVQTNLEAERAKAAKLIEALKSGMPALLKTRRRIEGTVKASADAYVKLVNNLPDTIKNAGAMGVGCVAVAVGVTAQATVQITASLDGAISVATAAIARAN